MAERPGYHDYYRDFTAASFTDALDGDLESAINACVECCDRYVGENRVALNWASASGEHAVYTFEDLQATSAQVANLLVAHGVQPGDRVAGLLPRIPELVALVLGTFRLGAVYQPLFTAFGPAAIEQRLGTSQAKVIVTDAANLPKMNEISTDDMVVMGVGTGTDNADVDFSATVQAQSTDFAPVMRTGSDALLLMSTSGTTGPPKGVKVPIRALPAIAAYMTLCVDLQPDDVFWNMADPGWAYGLYDGVIGALLVGHQMTLRDGPFTVESTAELIGELGVTNFAGAPTAYRMIMAAGPEAAAPLAANLRVASSAGEPLNPELMRWFKEHVGCNLYDQYGQTEIGMVLCNHHGLDHQVRPGAAGYAMPGFRLDVVDDLGAPVPVSTEGTLAVHIEDSPLFFFEGYLGREGEGWVAGYHLTGDTVEQNGDGTISFVGRNDDVISSAGYRIGPFDVESCLLEHAAVAESGVVGVPDVDRGELVKACVVLHPEFAASDGLATELQEHVRNRLSKHAYPRIVEFLDALPKTPSGKIQRFQLRTTR